MRTTCRYASWPRSWRKLRLLFAAGRFWANSSLSLSHTRGLEEDAVYKRLMKSKPAEARLAGNEGLVEHNVADILLSRLAASSDTSTDMWKAHAKVLHEALEHHIKEEESDIFHDLGQLYSDEERAKMGREYVVGRDKRLSSKPASTSARRRKAA